MKYYWLFVILLFGIKLLKDKELSSYTIKWMWAYIIYLLWLQVVVFDVNWSRYEKDIFNYILFAFVFPLSLYLFFPFIWKFLNKWRIFRWIEKKVDIGIIQLKINVEKKGEEVIKPPSPQTTFTLASTILFLVFYQIHSFRQLHKDAL